MKKEEEEEKKIDPERLARTAFVGNCPLDASKKDVLKVFRQYGSVEKVWFRSIACDHESKITHKGKIIKQQYGT